MGKEKGKLNQKSLTKGKSPEEVFGVYLEGQKKTQRKN